uniref:Uncharacterized protein n=1 Tax=viral metagenome TaxID=1070528 RepID=A0A6M3L8J3_9ZZZZ
MVEETERDPLDALSIWNLQEGFKTTPLVKFRGRLVGIVLVEGKPVMFQFTELEVIKSTEPYDLPTTELEVGWSSNRIDSKWGVFGMSLRPFLAEGQDLKDMIEHVIGMEFTAGHMLPRKNKETDKWESLPASAWEVFEVDGATLDGAAGGGKTPADIAEDLLNGKTLVEFNGAAVQIDAIRNDPEMLRAVSDKSFVASMVSSGKFTVDPDSGKYARVV